jgi:hypothetical protein
VRVVCRVVCEVILKSECVGIMCADCMDADSTGMRYVK